MIEHVNMPLRFLASCSDCIKPGGSLFVSTMNRNTKSYLMTILAAEYLLGILPAGTHEWNKYIKPEEMRLMIESSAVNMNVDSLVGMKLSFDIVSKSMKWRLSKYDTDINYILHATKN